MAFLPQPDPPFQTTKFSLIFLLSSTIRFRGVALWRASESNGLCRRFKSSADLHFFFSSLVNFPFFVPAYPYFNCCSMKKNMDVGRKRNSCNPPNCDWLVAMLFFRPSFPKSLIYHLPSCFKNNEWLYGPRHRRLSLRRYSPRSTRRRGSSGSFRPSLLGSAIDRFF